MKTPYQKGSTITLITDDVGIEMLVDDVSFTGLQTICDYSQSTLDFHGSGRIAELTIASYHK